MSKKLILAVSATVLLATTGTVIPAFADGKTDCTTESKEKWKPIAEAEAASKAAGYEVRRSKIDGACYEVYGVKDGTLYELFYNPVDLKHVHTIKK
jgi:hypothetical protein